MYLIFIPNDHKRCPVFVLPIPYTDIFFVDTALEPFFGSNSAVAVLAVADIHFWLFEQLFKKLAGLHSNNTPYKIILSLIIIIIEPVSSNNYLLQC